MSYPNSENFYNIPKRIVRRFAFCGDDDLTFFTKTNIGTGTQPTTVEDYNGGRVAVGGGNTTDNDGGAIYGTAEFMALLANGTYLLRVEFELDGDKTQSDHIIGWVITDTTPIASAPSDGIFLIKDDGDSVWDLVVYKSSSLVKRITGVFAADLNKHTVTIEIRAASSFASDGKCKIYVVVDGVHVLDDQGGGDAATNEVSGCPTTELTCMVATQNGDGTTQEICYVYDLAFDIPAEAA